MARRASHYTSANLLYSAVAYCDQWAKIMTIYDKYDELRVVVNEDPEEGGCHVLLIGDDEKALYWVEGVELGTVRKNMDACFKLYLELRSVPNPRFVYSKENRQEVETYQVLTHTRVGVMKHGQFRTIPDAASKIIPASFTLLDALTNLKIHDAHDSLDDYIHSLTGGDPMEEIFIRSGVFDD